ncbi:MAG: globin [Mycobacteriales bacterium]
MNPAPQPPNEPNLYEAMGGHETFDRLVAGFYARVATDSLLRPLYPEEDLAPARQRLLMFIEQYWGGPKTYSQLRGHPRLRMRHAPFVIGPPERDAWLLHMRAAMDEIALPSELDAQLWDYFQRAAQFMVNHFPPAELNS